MKLSDLSIKRPVLAVVMSLLLIVLGTMSFLRLTLRELPAIDPPIVSVSVDYTGASAAVGTAGGTAPGSGTSARAGIAAAATNRASRLGNKRRNLGGITGLPISAPSPLGEAGEALSSRFRQPAARR